MASPKTKQPTKATTKAPAAKKSAVVAVAKLPTKAAAKPGVKAAKAAAPTKTTPAKAATAKPTPAKAASAKATPAKAVAKSSAPVKNAAKSSKKAAPLKPAKVAKVAKAAPTSERLTESTLATTAMRIIRKKGLRGLSMRELGQELGVTQMAAYHYFENKQQLLVMIVDTTLAEVKVSDDPKLGWRAQVEGTLTAMFNAVSAVTGLDSVVASVGHTGQSRRIFTEIHDVLANAGLQPQAALLASSSLATLTFGHFAGGAQVWDAKKRKGSEAGLDKVSAELAKQLKPLDIFSSGVAALLASLESQGLGKAKAKRA